MDKKLLEILACPLCKGDVQHNQKQDELLCRFCGVAFPIKDEVPVMLEKEARTLTTDERLY